jgi:hypothetical protein
MKIQVVRKGEHKLSKVLGYEYFQPLVDSKILSATDVNMDSSELIQVLSWSIRSSNVLYEIIHLAKDISDYRRILEISISNLQISNSIGLWLTRNFFFPLKYDLPQFALCTISDVLRIAEQQGCKTDELKELQKLLEARPSITERRFLK